MGGTFGHNLYVGVARLDGRHLYGENIPGFLLIGTLVACSIYLAISLVGWLALGLSASYEPPSAVNGSFVSSDPSRYLLDFLANLAIFPSSILILLLTQEMNGLVISICIVQASFLLFSSCLSCMQAVLSNVLSYKVEADE